MAVATLTRWEREAAGAEPDPRDQLLERHPRFAWAAALFRFSLILLALILAAGSGMLVVMYLLSAGHN